ncbi:NCS2 family permease [Halonotius aquaticus]|uniref:NCS2 family permease n=1 Tax=Halonotius aquaticus TaxID=2216978 RepID=A0A3A6PYA0_9EURY|nr:NCS2 family permease [Halonotius aquaticus]RJX44746.1 NCS2 family permease [Halonotius aquaticus]
MGLNSFFDLDDHDTDVNSEVIAGATTFLAMAYIIVVNPTVLSNAISIEGYTDPEVFQMIAITTILASVAAMLVMALYANRPFGLAPGLGLNAFFAFTVVLGLGIPWQTALAAVFVEGIIFIVLTAIGAREYIINLFPEPVKFAVGAGIGVFLLFIGLQEFQVIVNDEATLVTLGSVGSNPVAILGLSGVALTLLLWARGITGSIIIGILTTAIAGWALTLGGVVDRGVLVDESVLSAVEQQGVIGVITGIQYDITPLAGAFIDGLSQVEPLTFGFVVLTFFFVDFFDTAGTLIGIAQFGDFLDENGELPEMDKPLMADAVGTTVGAMLGTSTVTTYIESSTGVEAGGRTGLTTLVVAALFLLMIPFVAIASAIPSYASFIALVIVGIIMFEGVVDIDWRDPAWSISAALTITIMPLTYSIADGLAAGIISYPLVKAASGEADDIRLGQWLLAAVLIVYFYIQTSGMLL